MRTSHDIFKYGVECNICHWKGQRFESDNWHPYTVCPNCRSEVRHRLFWALVNHVKAFNIKQLFTNKKVLHFAPEELLGKNLSKICAEYKTADFLSEGYSYNHIDYVIDITNMDTIEDGEYNCVIAFDILEHIPEHFKAMEEMYRILCKGGYCILTVPQKDYTEKTVEDLSITDPKEREDHFAQWDHVRIYGDDFPGMLESKGFEVCVLAETHISESFVKKHVLFPPILSEHPLATNYRKIFFGKK